VTLQNAQRDAADAVSLAVADLNRLETLAAQGELSDPMDLAVAQASVDAATFRKSAIDNDASKVTAQYSAACADELTDSAVEAMRAEDIHQWEALAVFEHAAANLLGAINRRERVRRECFSKLLNVCPDGNDRVVVQPGDRVTIDRKSYSATTGECVASVCKAITPVFHTDPLLASTTDQIRHIGNTANRLREPRELSPETQR